MTNDDHLQTSTIEVPSSHAEHGGGEGGGLLQPAPTLLGLTWVTFLLMVFVLYRIAWKPILKVLDEREETIRRSLDDAQATQEQTATQHERNKALLLEAQQQAAAMIEAGRRDAEETAARVRASAEQQAQKLIENARKEMAVATEKARHELRREASELAIELARKILDQNMDEGRSRAVIARTLEGA